MTNLKKGFNLGGHLARAGEEEPELVLVGGNEASLGDVHGGGGHRRPGGVDECELVGH